MLLRPALSATPLQGAAGLGVLPMSGTGPQDDCGHHVNEEAPMSTPLFTHPAQVEAELTARRERLARDWQQHPRRARRGRRLHLSFHLPVRARRHA